MVSIATVLAHMDLIVIDIRNAIRNATCFTQHIVLSFRNAVALLALTFTTG